MIYDTLRHIGSYAGIHPGVLRGLEILRDPDLAALPDGTYEVDGKNLYYFLQSYDTRPANDKPEAHRRYADIMMMLSGREKIGVAPLERVTDTGEDTEGDIRFYRGETVPILLDGDRFAVFFPGDAHAPGIAAGGVPERCRKCVIKVCLE